MNTTEISFGIVQKYNECMALRHSLLSSFEVFFLLDKLLLSLFWEKSGEQYFHCMSIVHTLVSIATLFCRYFFVLRVGFNLFSVWERHSFQLQWIFEFRATERWLTWISLDIFCVHSGPKAFSQPLDIGSSTKLYSYILYSNSHMPSYY